MSGQWRGGSGGWTPTWRYEHYRNPVGERSWKLSVTWLRTSFELGVGR